MNGEMRSKGETEKAAGGPFLAGLLDGVSLGKQSTIRIQKDRTVYFDPIGIAGRPGDADFIFISHGHYDHFSIDYIRKLAKPETVIVLPEDCTAQARDGGFKNITAAGPNKTYEVKGLRFATVPAYNTNKKFHRKEFNWVGYIVELGGVSYYFAGDTDNIPEMKDIRADVVFLPVGGTYTMTAEEAAAAANTIKPPVAVPIHYGSGIVGTPEDGPRFIKGLDPAIKGVLLK